MKNTSSPIDYLKTSVFLLVTYNTKKARFALSIFLLMLSGGVVLLSSQLTGSLVEHLAAKGTQNPWTNFVAPILVLEILNLVFLYYGKSTGTFVANDITLNIRLALFKKFSRLPMKYFDQVSIGELLTRSTSEVSGLEAFLTLSMPRVLISLIVVLLILAFMLFTDVYFGSLILLSSLPAVVFVFLVIGRIRDSLRAYKAHLAGLNGQFAEYLQILPLMKVDVFSRYSEKMIGASSEELLAKAIFMIKINSLARSFANLLCYFPTFMVLFVGGYFTLSQQLSLGLLVTFLRFSERLRRPVAILLTELQTLQDASVTVERLSALMSADEETQALPEPAGPLRRLDGNVVFDRVWLAYQPGKPVLKGLSFSVPRGSSVGLVGRTGSGKTTTISLISHLYTIMQGDITIDGQPLERWNRSHLRQQIGVVNQNPVFIRGTLRDNLNMSLSEGLDKARDDRALLDACKLTGLHDLMEKSSRDLDSPIHDNGGNLSAGECQLLAITRVLLRDPAILILDEASAHTDSLTEDRVEFALAQLKHGRTSFTVAHRLNSVVACDKILVFADGRVVEEGTHDDLLARKGEYFTLYRQHGETAELS
ncbi:ABC transporter ATP-binding protein [Massilia antarctica]|uniref:ABC transporter ATP-binding protein n=1 Tax=Massilia antarctica TaxID=2765360 RepID=A0AA48WIW3_9BURK|nr:ABC transporter ATP-binding protein [Massilia antarctica]QPI52409.1 ABC transporter ATP-binding protein [Massilia antarctica]